MGFNCGIIGLTNVGKSTIFNALTAQRVPASNYPFTTIDPNVGMVPLRDERLASLAAIVKPERTTPTSVEFVDIAGLVRGASKGEGLGNKFLGHIRNVDCVAHVVRCFEDPDVVHLPGKVDPARDIEIVETELMLADLETVGRRIEKLEKLSKAGEKAARKELHTSEEVRKCLEEGRPVRSIFREEPEALKELSLLTLKPVIYVANVGEYDPGGRGEAATAVRVVSEKEGAGFVAICGKIEAEMAELQEEEKAEFLKSLGIEESGLERLVREAYRVLRLITFFTVVGAKEVRAWTVKRGTRAQRAAGVIHSDFEKGFIKAEVASFEDFMASGSEAACREKGLLRIEGRDYVVRDGDIIRFRFAT